MCWSSRACCAARPDGRWLLLTSLWLAAACRADVSAEAQRRAASTASQLTAASQLAATADAPPDAGGWGRAAGLRYLEMIRGAASPAQALPMVVMIHGLGDRPRRELFDVVDAGVPARIILPQAPTPAGDGYAWFPYHFDGNDPEQLAQGIRTAADQLERALQVLREQRPTLGRPIVAGFSQGGMLSFALALRPSAQLALAQPISGTLPEPLWPHEAVKRAPPIRALHGMADTIVPIDLTRRLVAHLRELGYDATLVELPATGHTISERMQDSVHATLSQAVMAQARGTQWPPPRE